jgi:hypothetical protein
MFSLNIHEWIVNLVGILVGEFTVPGVLEFLKCDAIRPGSLPPYLLYDKSYFTRNLAYKCDLFEVLAICSDIGQTSLPQDR